MQRWNELAADAARAAEIRCSGFCVDASPASSPAPSRLWDIDMVGEAVMHDHVATKEQIKVWLGDADVMAIYRTNPEFNEVHGGLGIWNM